MRKYRYIREVTCDRCGIDISLGDVNVRVLASRSYDLCPACADLLNQVYSYVEQCIIRGEHYGGWAGSPFVNQEGSNNEKK